MTRFDDLDLALVAFFEGEAVAPAPQGLLELVTSGTARRRPRPAWQARLHASTVRMAPPSVSASRALLVGVAILLVLAAAVVVGSQLFPRPKAILEIFESTGVLPNQPDHVATSARLTDGRVVLSGGRGYVSLFDPTTGGFSTLSTPELYSRAAVAAGDDTVLLFGQDIREPDALEGISVVRLDGRTGVASPILASNTAFGDISPESAYVGLADGRVLILGQTLMGDNAGSAATLIYDPRTVGFVPGPDVSMLRGPATTIALPHGRVLLIEAADMEGTARQTMVVLDAGAASVVSNGTIEGRAACTWTVLADGRVLVAGGVASANDAGAQTVLDTALLIDPRGATVTVTPTGRMPEGRWMHGAALLSDGRVLLVGGDLAPAAPFTATASTVFYRPATNDFAPGPPMARPRIAAKVVPLADGRVLVASHYGLAPNAPATGAELTAEVFR
jgi:hypothetical protein